MTQAYKRGILYDNYALFHSSDHQDLDFQSHYHDFSKIVFCLRGRVSYTVEGNTYHLSSGDILIIPEQMIHQSSIDGKDVYERYILWISQEFIEKWNDPALDYLMHKNDPRFVHMLHPALHDRSKMIDMLSELDNARKEALSGHRLLSDTYFLQFLITLNHILESQTENGSSVVQEHPFMNDLLRYINEHLTDDLSIESLAERFYLSPSYLMHIFVRHTGCPIHRYILQKRLIHAADQIRTGTPIIMASQSAGFNDYSTFLKAFRHQYGCSPREWKK